MAWVKHVDIGNTTRHSYTQPSSPQFTRINSMASIPTPIPKLSNPPQTSACNTTDNISFSTTLPTLDPSAHTHSRHHQQSLGWSPSNWIRQHGPSTLGHIPQCQHHKPSPPCHQLASNNTSCTWYWSRHPVFTGNQHQLDQHHHPSCQLHHQQHTLSCPQTCSLCQSGTHRSELSTRWNAHRGTWTMDSKSHLHGTRWFQTRKMVLYRIPRWQQHQIHYTVWL